MARRKRLNKRMVMLLVVLGLLAVIGAFVVAIPRLFPEAPEALAREAGENHEQGNYKDAVDLWVKAIGASRRLSKGPLHEYYYKLALTQLEWADNDKELNKTQRSDLRGGARKALGESLHTDAEFLPARQKLCEVLWVYGITGGSGRILPGAQTEDYLAEAAELVRQDPNDHLTIHRMGRIKAYKAVSLDFGGEWVDKALKDFRRAIELKTDNPEYWLALARFLWQRDLKDKAEKVYGEAIAANPANADIRVNYASFLLKARRDSEKAKVQIREAIVRDPASPAGHVAMADVHLSEKEPEKAIESLHKARKIDPLDVNVCNRLARLYTSQRKPEQAIATVRQGLADIEEQAVKTSADAKSLEVRKLAGVRLRLNIILADLLLQRLPGAEKEQADKLLAEAKACLKQIQQSWKDMPTSNEIAGRIAFAERRWDQAFELLRRAYDQSAGQISGSAILTLIRLYDGKGNPGESHKIIMGMLKLKPTDTWLLQMKVERDLRFRRYDDASRSLTKLLQVDPDNTWAQAKRAVLRARTDSEVPLADLPLSRDDIRLLLERVGVMLEDRRTDEALRFALELRKRAPKNMTVLAVLANVYVVAGKDEEAVKLLQEAQAQDPGNPIIARLLDLIREKDPEKRHKIRVAAIKSNSANDPFHTAQVLAKEYLQMGKRAEYLRYMQEADKLAPNNPFINKKLFLFALSERDWSLAEKYAGKAKEGNFDRADGNIFAARLAAAKGDLPRAVELMSETVREHPELKDAWDLLGRCYLGLKTTDPSAARKNVEKADHAFREAIGKDPGYLSSVVGMVHVAVRLGDRKQEREWVRRARQLPGGRANSYVTERHLLIEEEATTDEALISGKLIPDRERILEKKPKDLTNRMALGRLYERVQRHALAEDMYRYVFDHATNKLGAARVLANFYVRMGRRNEVNKLFGGLVALVKTDERKAFVWTVWGETMAGYNLTDALGAFDLAIAKAPTFGPAYRAKAQALAGPPHLRWKEAIAVMRKWLDVSPKKVSADVKILCRYLIKAGQTDTAISRLNDILRIDPKDVEAMAMKGSALAKKGDSREAEILLDRAHELNRRHHLPLRYLVDLHFSQGDIYRGKETLERLWRLTGRTDDGIRLASFCWRDLREYHDAERLCLVILRNDRTPQGRIMATRELLGIYRAQKKWSRMEKLLADARKEFPQEVGFLREEAWMWIDLKNPRRAITAMTGAVEKSPGDPSVLSDYLTVLLKVGKYADVLRVAEEHKDREDWAVVLSASRAAALVRLDRSGEADALFVSALKQAKPDELALVVARISHAHGVSGSAKKLASWERHRPGDLQLHLMLADLYNKQSRAERKPTDFSLAPATLRKALKLAKTPHERVLVNFQLASIEQQTARWNTSTRARCLAEAEKAYKAVLEDSPNHVKAMNNLAYLYTDDLNQPAKAEPYAMRAVRLHPTGPNILDTYGWTLAKLGKYDKAAELLERAVRLAPTPELRYHLGWVLEKKEEWPRALREYEAAQKDPRSGMDKGLKELLTNAIERVRRKSNSGEE